MKLLREINEDIAVISEAGPEGKKNLFIEGVFMQYDMKNKNGRIYPKAIMEKEVSRYVKEKVETKRATGELQHPLNPSINLERVSHLIEKLKFESNGTVYGKAKILDTAMGNIARGLIDGGVNIGVSSRGLGTLKQSAGGMEVQEDFHIVTPADLVSDPSAPDAFVQGIMEDSEWFYNEKNGTYMLEKNHEIKKEISRMSMIHIEAHKMKLFENWIKSL